jgi:APA family basic amino acid/polyamine antiporter
MGTLSLVVGNIIGVGIFTTTGYMATYIQSPFWMLIAWVAGAFYAISGALVYGVLSEKYPLSGGDYQYLSRSVHPLGGYLFGWAAFFVTYSGSVAALGIAAAFYLNGLFPQFSFEYSILSISLPLIDFNFTLTKLIAIIFIFGFSWINYRGIVLSGTSQIILTSGIFLLLILFSVSGTVSQNADFQLLVTGNEGDQNFSGFLAALIAVLFAYMGWTTAVYVAEEVDHAKSTLPKALIVGVLVVGGIYLWVNMVYLMTIPITEMPDVINIGTMVAIRLWGSGGQFIISGLILVAVLSSLNSTILSGPRIYMAMGRDGYLMGKTAILHPVYEAPHIAIVWQGVWSVILVLSGSFNELLSFVVFVVIIFSIAAGMISLSIALKQSIKNWLSVFGSAFYLIFCLIILVNTLWQRPVEAVIGLLLTAIAIPFYYLEKKRKIPHTHK